MRGEAESTAPPEPPASASLGRRRFLSWLSITLTGYIGLLIGVPFVSFIIGPLVQHVPPTWRKVGRIDSFKIGTTTKVSFLDPSPMLWAGVTAETAAWLRRVDDSRFIAFSVNCAHLGCPVRWLPKAHLFMCPCHGGVYYADGSVAAGPPPRGLFRYPVRLRNGSVEILASAVPIE